MVFAPVYIPAVYKASLFSTSFPRFAICRLFDDGHSDRCEVIFHWDLRFPDISDVEHPFVFGHVTLMLLSLLICKMITILGAISVSS